MVAIKLYDIETGHVETLTEVASAESARAWLASFGSGGIGANDVIYTAEINRPDRRPPARGPAPARVR